MLNEKGHQPPDFRRNEQTITMPSTLGFSLLTHSAEGEMFGRQELYQ